MSSVGFLPEGCGWFRLRWWPVIQSDVVTTLMPRSSSVQKRSTSGQTPLKFTTSGFAASTSSSRFVARTPTGAVPTISPASRPTFSGV